ncbi:dTMP kinase [Lichenihabitans psoromatis]|uniref:dTMP kinase n=1 Tax=Lichenihabitans psoromatis TaxID=2528642 RepID=UPI0010368CD2|nr:dTMP kinase [Lichenihabitans psoromatis]
MSSSADLNGSSPGFFITLEGGEGAGKSTQSRLLVERLAASGLEAIATREPGGTPLAETYRTALLSGAIAPLGPAAEAIAFSAARIDHLDRKIAPALARGISVVCDRFIDSTRAYQGALGQLDPRLIAALECVVVGRHRPNLTLMLDLPSEIGLARAAARRGNGAVADRFEQQDLAFHDGLRRAFLNIATEDHGRCVVIDATRPPDAVAEAIWQAVTSRLLNRRTVEREP